MILVQSLLEIYITDFIKQKGKKTAIIRQTKKCYMNVLKLQTQIEAKNKKGELLNKDKIEPKKISTDQLYQLDPDKYKSALERWKCFRKKIGKVNGIFLLQTIGSIIRAQLICQGRIAPNSQEEQIKLIYLLEENKEIIDFLSREKDHEDKEKKEITQLRNSTLIPKVNPEEIYSLDVIEKFLKELKNLLKGENLKEIERLKLEQLIELFMKQKNILIENETEKLKRDEGNGFLKIIFKNFPKYLKKEKEKILKAKEEENKKIEKSILEQNKEEQLKKTKNLNNKEKISTIEVVKNFNKQTITLNNNDWKDNTFEAERKSLCPYDKKGNWIKPINGKDEYLNGWKNIKWSRIDEIKKYKEIIVFYEGATLDDIKQGEIGDCYFLSALGALCKNFPNFIESHFYLEKEGNHIYGITFFINGRWQRVLVDDFFPCIIKENNQFGEFYFSCSFQNEIWVSLIEKAWAKINGSYANIDYGGYSYEAFDILTEAYSEHILIKKKDKEEIWKILKNAEERQYLMTVASKKFNFWNIKLVIYGLDEKHAYTVVKTLFIEEDKTKLVQLRNPYGEKVYNGDWGKSSKKWTPELKVKYKYDEEVEKYDGMFCMSFDEFYDCFENLDICKIEKDYQTSYCKINKNQANKYQVLELEVEKGKVFERTFIQLYKRNLRILKKKIFLKKILITMLILIIMSWDLLYLQN